MIDPLLARLAALRAFCGVPKVFVLPYPYKNGHFRVSVAPFAGEDEPPCGFSVRREGRCLFVTLTDEALQSDVYALAASCGDVSLPQPSLGAAHTLLFRLLQGNALPDAPHVPLPLLPEQRLLHRLALELPRRVQKPGGRELQTALLLLQKQWAVALRQKAPLAPLIAPGVCCAAALQTIERSYILSLGE